MLGRTVLILMALGASTVGTSPAAAQKAKPKHYAVSTHHAVGVTKEVLVRQGFEVVRIEVVSGDQVVYYRRGNMGKGKGKGPVERLVIRRVDNRIVFVDTPDFLLVDIDVRLKLP
jgi:hypothetical protein